jgi:hypothetical protein
MYLKFSTNINRSPVNSPGGTNILAFKDYSASKTGLAHLNMENMIKVPEEIKNEINNLRLPAFVSTPVDIGKFYSFLIVIETETDEKTGKLGSLTTIFSIWNTMVGSGLLTLPWGYSNSGLALGLSKQYHLNVYTIIVITLISFLISYYTCYLVIKTAGTDIDYTDTLQKHFGRIGWTVGMTIFILNLFVPIMIYF